ncbi:MAG: glycoside hydrolase family 97 catalytic domain-containing protein [Mucilaginibacter sp.]|uniref:glycoside hydrolase family 97 protein n=1 Tax=Mucilaginibacter sp. TaxID=1882438 RepID=UPI00326682D4
MKKSCYSSAIINNELKVAIRGRGHFYRLMIFLFVLFFVSVKESKGQDSVLCSSKSPDGHTQVQIKLNNIRQLSYRVVFNKKTMIDWSVLGLKTDRGNYVSGVSITEKEEHNHQESFEWPLGEDARIDNNFREILLHCQSADANFELSCRIYNGSFCFRYMIRNLTGQKPLRLEKELTEFNFTQPYTIYQYHEESIFRPVQIDSLPGISDLPSTMVSRNHIYLSVGEAENRNYSKSVLIKGSKPQSLALSFYIDTLYRNHAVSAIQKDTQIVFRDSLITPWRTISFATSAIGLHQFSALNLKLVTPVSNVIPKGIKPGKVFRVPISTKGAIDGADFAARQNFQYIMLDAGWYGAEFRTTSDPTKPIPTVDMASIIAHARSKGIGVILYVNYVGLKAKIDTILPLFKKWGVAGIKFGFVDGGTQQGLTWLDSAMQKVSDWGFILNVHDHYKPTGLSRRYPNNLSQEGIRGDENSPDAFHTTVLPYTRYLAGPADFTFCYPNSRDNFAKNLKVSKGQQMALTVVYFDPLQAIFWYGRSEDYKDENDIEFFRYVPTVWDQSIYLAGEIGESISVVRKKDNIWYMGSAAGLNKWNTSVKLDFLDKGKPYTATIYEDDNAGGVRKREIRVKKGDVLPIELNAKGGQAIIYRPDRS